MKNARRKRGLWRGLYTRRNAIEILEEQKNWKINWHLLEQKTA